MNWKLSNKTGAGEKPLMEQIRGFDERSQKSMVHVRLDRKTAILLKQLKMATGVEIQQVIAFSVSELIRQHPELKTIIKDFLTKLNE
jgi:hypothetical protein